MPSHCHQNAFDESCITMIEVVYTGDKFCKGQLKDDFLLQKFLSNALAVRCLNVQSDVLKKENLYS